MHQSLMIFYPGGVSYGTPFDISSDEEVFDMMYTAATIEEGNGNGKIKERDYPSMDERFGSGTRKRFFRFTTRSGVITAYSI